VNHECYSELFHEIIIFISIEYNFKPNEKNGPQS